MSTEINSLFLFADVRTSILLVAVDLINLSRAKVRQSGVQFADSIGGVEQASRFNGWHDGYHNNQTPDERHAVSVASGDDGFVNCLLIKVAKDQRREKRYASMARRLFAERWIKLTHNSMSRVTCVCVNTVVASRPFGRIFRRFTCATSELRRICWTVGIKGPMWFQQTSMLTSVNYTTYAVLYHYAICISSYWIKCKWVN